MGQYTVDVREFGAKCDGWTDDTVAAQAALDSVAQVASPATSTGGIVYVPSGYMMVRGLDQKNHVYMRGAGMFSTTIKLIAGSTKDVVKLHTSSGPADPNAGYCGIFDLTIDGRKSSQGRTVRDGILSGSTRITSATANFSLADNGKWVRGTGIPYGVTMACVNSTTAILSVPATVGGTTPVSGVSLQIAPAMHGISIVTNPLNTKAVADPYFDLHHYLNNVHVYMATDNGVHMNGRSASVLDNVFVESCGGHGILSAYDTIISNCQAGSNTFDGFNSNAHSHIALTACKSFLNGGAGYHLTGGSSLAGMQITTCSAQNNRQQGFFVDGTYRVVGSALISDTNSQAGSGLFAGYEVKAARHCDISGVSVQSAQAGASFYTQSNGLRLWNGSDLNVIQLSHSSAGGASLVGSALTTDSVLLANRVIMNAKAL